MRAHLGRTGIAVGIRSAAMAAAVPLIVASIVLPVAGASTPLPRSGRGVSLTYLGGSGDDGILVAADESGGLYVAGGSSSADLPGGAPVFEAGPGGAEDVFVMKLGPDGRPQWTARFGGGADDEPYGVAVAEDGTVHVAGNTLSSDFPTTPGALAEAPLGGERDVFVVTLSPDGGSFGYATYLGGSGWDKMNGNVLLDPDGGTTVVGATTSSDLPTSSDAPQRSFMGGDGYFEPNAGLDGFVARLDRAGSTVTYGSFIGGAGDDLVNYAARVGDGGLVLAGASTSDDLPGTVGGVQPAHASCQPGPPPCSDGFLAVLDAKGQTIEWATYLGGAGYDDLTGVDLGADGSVTVAGASCGPFPVTAGAYMTQRRSDCDDIVARLDPSGSALVYATYAGPGDHADERVIVDDDGRAILVTETASDAYPVTPQAFQPSFGGGPLDVVVLVLSPNGTQLEYATYIGGSQDDMYWSSHPVLRSDGRLHVSGLTGSADLPTTADAPQPASAGGYDGFLVTIDTGSR
jgi:hypothetical protein